MKKAIKPALFFLLVTIITSSSVLWSSLHATNLGVDLGVENPGLLPSNPFYFVKEWSRGVRMSLTFDLENKVELEILTLNHRAAEISKLVRIIPGNTIAINEATKKYNSNLNNLISQFKDLSGKKIKSSELNKVVINSIKHTQLFNNLQIQLSDKRLKSVDSAINDTAKLLSIAIDSYKNPEELRKQVIKLKENQKNNNQIIQLIEALDKAEDSMVSNQKIQINRAKEDLLVDLISQIKFNKIDSESLKEIPGNFVTRLKVFDEIRYKIDDADLKSQISKVRQSIIEQAVTDELITENLAQQTYETSKKLAYDIRALKRTGAQVQFHLGQANKSFSEKEYIAALGQSSMAAAATKNNWRYLKNVPAYYQSELELLKISYDKLVKNKKTAKRLVIAEEKIIDLSDLVKGGRLKSANSKTERLIFDIKLLLSEIRYSL
jgi:hypothetical protein